MRRLFYFMAFVLFAGLLFVRVAYAQHETNGAGNNEAQNYISHADVPLTGAAAAVQVLPANPARVTAICVNVGASNAARIGDSSIGAAQGTVLAASGGVTLDTTSALYAYSFSGTTINCGETIRP